MMIDNLDKLTFDVGENDETGLTIVTFSDPETLNVLGSLSINRERADAFLDVLKTIFRETHGAFEINQKATARFENRTTGTLEFRDA